MPGRELARHRRLCHAEEVALDHMSYLTIGCRDTGKARLFCDAISGPKLKTIVSDDVA